MGREGGDARPTPYGVGEPRLRASVKERRGETMDQPRDRQVLDTGGGPPSSPITLLYR